MGQTQNAKTTNRDAQTPRRSANPRINNRETTRRNAPLFHFNRARKQKQTCETTRRCTSNQQCTKQVHTYATRNTHHTQSWRFDQSARRIRRRKGAAHRCLACFFLFFVNSVADPLCVSWSEWDGGEQVAANALIDERPDDETARGGCLREDGHFWTGTIFVAFLCFLPILLFDAVVSLSLALVP